MCISIDDIRTAMSEDTELQMLKWYIIKGWLHARDKMEPGLERDWLI